MQKLLNKGQIKEFLKSDRAILMLCIFIALFFWWLNKMSNIYRTDSQCEIDFILPEGKIFLEIPPETVTVEIEGEGWSLLSEFFRGSLPAIVYPLDDVPTQIISSGQIMNAVTEKLGASLRVVAVGESAIFVRLDTVAQKEIPVKLPFTLGPADGHVIVDSVRIEPATVVVSGPSKEVNRTRAVFTEKLDLPPIEGVINEKIALPLEEGSVISYEPSHVRILGASEPYTEGELPVPITVLHDFDSISIFPKISFVSFRAPLSQYKSIRSEDFQVIADLKGKEIGLSGKSTQALELTGYPEEVSAVRVKPGAIEYFIIQTVQDAE